MLTKVTTIKNDFSGQDFFVGLDVHKKSWKVNVRSLQLEVASFSQEPDIVNLNKTLRNKFPEGKFYSAYEAGFCGTRIHKDLVGIGINNIIIHPGDLPQTDKQKKNKTDLHDSRAIACYLEKKMLRPIYVMPTEQEELRSLFRCRQSKVVDVVRSNLKLKSFLDYFNIPLPDEFKQATYVSGRYISYLKSITITTSSGTLALQQYVDDLIYQRNQKLELTRKLRKIITEKHSEAYNNLVTVPGIGGVIAMALIAEIGDFTRFKNPDQYASYLGLVPSEHSSGMRIMVNGIQPRCNKHLRPLLIEAAWACIRNSPSMLLYYKKHFDKNNKKAIIKVARKLALTAKAVVVKNQPFKENYNYIKA